MRFIIPAFAIICFSTLAHAQSVTIAESFDVGQKSRVSLKVELTGEIAGPMNKRIDIIGESLLKYDERILQADDAGKVLRVYRDVDFQRTINGERQSQSIRNSVRRMVVLRSAEGKKAPFSPDGPLTFGEIDAVRVDLFSPVLVAGILPSQAVKPGDEWNVAKAAALDLTGLDTIESGTLKAKYIASVTIGGVQKYRLAITGDVKGVSEDGPTKQSIDATAYFDPKLKMLSYLSLKGIQELHDGQGKTVGRLIGRLTLEREPSESESVADAVLKVIDVKPSDTNTQLLYDNRDLKIQLTYPRHWRIGAVQGNQITIESASLSTGMLITAEPAGKLPTAEQFYKEAQQFIKDNKGTVESAEPPKRVGEIDRFSLAVTLNKQNAIMDYAIKGDRNGGVTVAARMPKSVVTDARSDVDRIVKSIVVKTP